MQGASGRNRLLAWLGGLAVLAGAVVVLRQGQSLPETPTTTTEPRAQVVRFAADGVVMPQPGRAPQPPGNVQSVGSGPGRVRVAWGPAVAGGRTPANAVGYDVRWRPLGRDSGTAEQALVAAPEVELSALTPGVAYEIEVRSVDAFGRRSPPARTTAAAAIGESWDPALFRGLAEQFDGRFSVDTLDTGARWHLSGFARCTSADVQAGALTVDLACGEEQAVLRARYPMQLAAPNAAGERGRILVVTDAAGPRGRLAISLVPGPADRVGSARADIPVPSSPANGRQVVDPALPDGALQVLIDDDGARVLTGLNVPVVQGAVAAAVPLPAPARGVGVLHVFEVLITDGGVLVLQDGVAAAVAPVVPPWSQAYLLIGVGGPPGQRTRVRLDGVGFTGEPSAPPPDHAYPVVPVSQRVFGMRERGSGVGVARAPLAGALSARFVATIIRQAGVDLDGLVLQQGDVVVPARPVLGAVPPGYGAAVTVAAELPQTLLGPDGPADPSPLVLRAPGAESTGVPINGGYFDIVPLPGHGPAELVQEAGAERPAPESAPPVPSLRLTDGAEGPVGRVAAGSKLGVDLLLDGLGGQLISGSLVGVAGLELWMDSRRIAGLSTAVDGAGVGGRYPVTITTAGMPPGRHYLELRVIPVDPRVPTASAVASWQLH